MARGLGDVPSNYGRPGRYADAPYGTFDPYGNGGGINAQYLRNQVGALAGFVEENPNVVKVVAVAAALWFLTRR